MLRSPSVDLIDLAHIYMSTNLAGHHNGTLEGEKRNKYDIYPRSTPTSITLGPARRSIN